MHCTVFGSTVFGVDYFRINLSCVSMAGYYNIMPNVYIAHDQMDKCEFT